MIAHPPLFPQMFALALSNLIATFFLTDIDALKSGANKWSGIFAAIGAGAYIAGTCDVNVVACLHDDCGCDCDCDKQKTAKQKQKFKRFLK